MRQSRGLLLRSYPRDPITYEHLQIKGLYPCGEGQVMAESFLRPLMVRNALL
jgi:hypothetical protein